MSDAPKVVWVCWRVSGFDTEQVCRHEGCGWRTITDHTEGET